MLKYILCSQNHAAAVLNTATKSHWNGWQSTNKLYSERLNCAEDTKSSRYTSGEYIFDIVHFGPRSDS